MTESQSIPDPERREGQEQGEPRFSFTDKRKVDPTGGTARPSEAGAPAEAEPIDPIDAEAAALFEQSEQSDAAARVAELEAKVAELEEEGKRSQAEYVNSRRRIEAAAQVQTQAAVGRVLASLISVLDDIEAGRQAGDITEGTPLASISAKLEDTLATQGLTRYGAVGDAFDPNLHEALMHEDSDEVDGPHIKLVVQPGYTHHDRVLRPARVATHG